MTELVINAGSHQDGAPHGCTLVNKARSQYRSNRTSVWAGGASSFISDLPRLLLVGSPRLNADCEKMRILGNYHNCHGMALIELKGDCHKVRLKVRRSE